MILCPVCKGKGYVFNRMSLLLTVALPIAWMMDSDMLREECSRCEGEGVIEYEET
jgi:hypothetical protein